MVSPATMRGLSRRTSDSHSYISVAVYSKDSRSPWARIVEGIRRDIWLTPVSVATLGEDVTFVALRLSNRPGFRTTEISMHKYSVE